MADEQRGEIEMHDDIGEVGFKMGVDDIVDKEIKEKHDDVGKGAGMIDSLRGEISITVRRHN